MDRFSRDGNKFAGVWIEGELIPDEVARGIAIVQPVKAAPYFAHAQFSTPETILALPDPGDAIPYVKAMWLYMRGVAMVQRRDFAGARIIFRTNSVWQWENRRDSEP